MTPSGGGRPCSIAARLIAIAVLALVGCGREREGDSEGQGGARPPLSWKVLSDAQGRLQEADTWPEAERIVASLLGAPMQTSATHRCWYVSTEGECQELAAEVKPDGSLGAVTLEGYDLAGHARHICGE